MRLLRAVAVIAVVALAAAPAGVASEERPTVAELEREVVCPTCNTTLDMSRSPIADQMRDFIRQRIDAGDTKTEIKEALVAEFGEEVLAAPPRRGFNLLAWLLPLGGGTLAIVVLGVLARRWARARAGATTGAQLNGRAPIDPALERRLDEELARYEA
ncbi:MAG: cytochrome c-type biogenesis protein CcmH [Actinobacteria bacterium]|nr:cytochrome c-type biogenesis protein CcmH [Actinomycetota bacterium]